MYSFRIICVVVCITGDLTFGADETSGSIDLGEGSTIRTTDDILKYEILKKLALLSVFKNHYKTTVEDIEVHKEIEPFGMDYVLTTNGFLDSEIYDPEYYTIDLDQMRNHLIYFISTDIHKPTDIQIFAGMFTKYLAFKAMLNYRACALFYYHALPTPDVESATMCEKIAHFFAWFNQIESDSRLWAFSTLSKSSEFTVDDIRTKFGVLDVYSSFLNFELIMEVSSSENAETTVPIIKPIDPSTPPYTETEIPVDNFNFEQILKENFNEEDSKHRYHDLIWQEITNFFAKDLIDATDYFTAIYGEATNIQYFPKYEESMASWDKESLKMILEIQKENSDNENESNAANTLIRIELEKASFSGLGNVELPNIDNLKLIKTTGGVADYKIILD